MFGLLIKGGTFLFCVILFLGVLGNPWLLWDIAKFLAPLFGVAIGIGVLIGLVGIFFDRPNKDRVAEGTDDVASDRFARRIADAIEERLAEIGATDAYLEFEKDFTDAKHNGLHHFRYKVTGDGFDPCEHETGRRYLLDVGLWTGSFGKAQVRLIHRHDGRVREHKYKNHGSVAVLAETFAPKIKALQDPLLDRFESEAA